MDEMPGGDETASSGTDYCHFEHDEWSTHMSALEHELMRELRSRVGENTESKVANYRRITGY